MHRPTTEREPLLTRRSNGSVAERPERAAVVETDGGCTIQLPRDALPETLKTKIQHAFKLARKQRRPKTLRQRLNSLLEYPNRLIWRRPFRASELCDFPSMPYIIRAKCQNMLTQQWIRKLPFIQRAPPAHIAAEILDPHISKVADAHSEIPLSVIDFCAGAGGPTPFYENFINAKRLERDQTLIGFKLSDLYPNQDAWMNILEQSTSRYLTFLPEPVDAANPSPAAMSVLTPDPWKANSSFHNDERVFRTYNLCFHHFDNETAKKILDSSMKTSDGFAIVELQDRRIGCIAMFLQNFLLVFGITWLWFPFYKNWIQNILTYTGILPFILTWDAVGSCLRTREFEEVMELIGQLPELERPAGSTANSVPPNILIQSTVEQDGSISRTCRMRGWEFKSGRTMHTFPFGYVNWIVGAKAQDAPRNEPQIWSPTKVSEEAR